jgi:hypothetical protein
LEFTIALAAVEVVLKLMMLDLLYRWRPEVTQAAFGSIWDPVVLQIHVVASIMLVVKVEATRITLKCWG